MVLGLVGLALWRYGAIGPKKEGGQFTADELAKMKTGAEAPDTAPISQAAKDLGPAATEKATDKQTN